ncbi:hypothetical protein Tco_1129558 [Tanacetum coccineum]
MFTEGPTKLILKVWLIQFLMIRLILWGHEHTQNLSPNEKKNSSDPFNLYNLLNKRNKGEANSGLDSSIPFLPGFTHEREFQHVDAQEGRSQFPHFRGCSTP